MASQQLLAHVRHPVGRIELKQRRRHGWATLRPALARMSVSANRPAAALAQITGLITIVIDQLERGLRPDGALDTGLGNWLPALLEHPSIHLVLVSQIWPTDSRLTTLAACGQLTPIGAAALAFSADEVRALWRQRQGSDLYPEQAEQLVAQTGGLAAAVALACATGWTPGRYPNVLLRDLENQLLATAPARLRELVIDTAALAALTSERIAQLTGQPDGDGLLRQLHQYVLLPDPTAGTVHPLVRQAALQRLRADPERYRRLVRRAVDHALAEGCYHEAWELAAGAKRWELARTVVLAAAQRLRQDGASQTIIEWIDMLPPEQHTHDLTILRARCQGEVGDLDGAILTLAARRAAATDPVEQREATIWLAALHQTRGDLQAADGLIQPYLADASLAPVWQARVLRIHAAALAKAGDGAAALTCIAQSMRAAQAAHEPRLLALLYGDQAAIAGAMGHLAEAEQALRLAERCWRDLQSLPDLAVTLNNRAMLLLSLRDDAAAATIAEQARAHALAGGRLRDAAVASATRGDVAFAQTQYREAQQHYRVAADDGAQSGYRGIRVYALAMLAHVARLCGDTDQASALLLPLRHQQVESAEHAGWRASGIVAAQLALGMEPALSMLEDALAAVGADLEDVQVALLILLAQAHWRSGATAAACATWTQLETGIMRRHGVAASRLLPLATAEPALLAGVTAAGSTPLAAAALRLPARSTSPHRGATQRTTEPRLRLRVFGPAPEITWQDQPITIPALGYDLLLLLLTTSGPLAEGEILNALWGEDAASSSALEKLVVRLRQQLPGSVRRREGRYALTLSRHDLDVDLLMFLELDLATAATAQLRAAGQAAASGRLPHHTAAWADQLRRRVRQRPALPHAAASGCLPHPPAAWADSLRRRVRQRLALLWLELGRRAEQDGDHLAAHDAFEQALDADPTSDHVARAVLSHAERCGDRTLVIQRYLRYQQALAREFGTDPARDLEARYRQALEP